MWHCLWWNSAEEKLLFGNEKLLIGSQTSLLIKHTQQLAETSLFFLLLCIFPLWGGGLPLSALKVGDFHREMCKTDKSSPSLFLLVLFPKLPCSNFSISHGSRLTWQRESAVNGFYICSYLCFNVCSNINKNLIFNMIMLILTLCDTPELVDTWLNFRGYILSIVFDNSLANIKEGKKNFYFTKNLGR